MQKHTDTYAVICVILVVLVFPLLSGCAADSVFFGNAGKDPNNVRHEDGKNITFTRIKIRGFDDDELYPLPENREIYVPPAFLENFGDPIGGGVYAKGINGREEIGPVERSDDARNEVSENDIFNEDLIQIAQTETSLPVKKRDARLKKPVNIIMVIRDANQGALVAPSPEQFDGAVIEYDYMPSKIYSVYCTPRKISDIRFGKGEQIISVAAGDTVNYLITKVVNADREDLLVKAIYPGLKTNLIVHTNFRRYIFSLISNDKVHLNAVAFKYKDETPQQNQLDITKTEKTENEERIFTYKMDSSDCPGCILPATVYEIEGKGKICIRMPKEIDHVSLPVLFTADENGNREFINYRYNNQEHKLVVDGLYNHLVLKYEGENKVIHIIRHGFDTQMPNFFERIFSIGNGGPLTTQDPHINEFYK